MSGDAGGSGFGEGGQSAFALDDAVAFRRLVLDLYGHRCAVTGHEDEGLDVFLFQPLEHGGTLVVGNALAVEPAVASLLAQGLLLISDDFVAFAPHPEVIGLESNADTVRGHRIRLPEAVSMWPDRTMLAYHRSLFRAQ